MADELAEYCSFFPTDPLCAAAPEPEPEPVDPVEPEKDMDKEDDKDMDKDMDGKDKDMDDYDKDMDGKKGGKSEEDMMIWEGMKFEQLMEWAMRDPMMGQITYSLVAVGQAVHYGLVMFRYYNNERLPASVGDTDYFGLAHMIGGYGGLALWTVAAITQLLSVVGIAASTDYFGL